MLTMRLSVPHTVAEQQQTAAIDRGFYVNVMETDAQSSTNTMR